MRRTLLLKSRSIRRTVTVLALGGIYLAGSAVAGVPAAHADAVDLACVGTNDAEFSPGLTFVPRTVGIEAEGTFTSCVSSDPAVKSGAYTASGEGAMSCLTGGHAGDFTIAWNTGEQSTIAFTNAIAVRPGGEVVVVASGRVTAGKFIDDTYTGTFTLFHLDLFACLRQDGVSVASGPTILLLTSAV